MSIRKGFVSLASIFVEMPSKSSPGGSLFGGQPPPGLQIPDLTLDFLPIYRLANISSPAVGAEQALGIIESVPGRNLNPERRQMAKGLLLALKNSGASAVSVASDASAKIAALESHARSLTSRTDAFVAKTSSDIAALEAEIQQKREAINAENMKSSVESGKCLAEARRLRVVIDVFGGG